MGTKIIGTKIRAYIGSDHIYTFDASLLDVLNYYIDFFEASKVKDEITKLIAFLEDTNDPKPYSVKFELNTLETLLKYLVRINICTSTKYFEALSLDKASLLRENNLILENYANINFLSFLFSEALKKNKSLSFVDMKNFGYCL